MERGAKEERRRGGGIFFGQGGGVEMDRRRDDGIAFFSFRATEGGGGRGGPSDHVARFPAAAAAAAGDSPQRNDISTSSPLSFFLSSVSGGEGSLCAPHLRPSAGPQGHLAACTSLPRIRKRKRECPFRIPHNDPCAGCVCVALHFWKICSGSRNPAPPTLFSIFGD